MKRLFYLLALVLAGCLLYLFSRPARTPQSPHTPPTAETAPSTNEETPTTQSTETNESTPDQKIDVRTPPSSTSTNAPASTPILKHSSKKLVVYVEKSTIPKAWLEAWNKDITVDQRILTPGQEAPTDGDLYAISPRFFNELRGKIDFAKYESPAGLEGVNPAFLGQGFDLDNEWTRPWRWTPYFIYVRGTVGANGKVVTPALTTAWWKSQEALFTTDTDWLVALKMKEEGKSANLIKSSNWSQTFEQVQKDVSGRTASEEECWQALKDGKAQFSFLPASMRLRAPNEDPANLAWFAPQKGTIAQFDLLAIPRNSQSPEAALSLVKFLLQPEQQQKLMPEIGYFPVKCETGKETRATIAVPAGTWFGGTEFLLKPSVENISKAVPVSAPATQNK